MDLPGVQDKDVDVQINKDILTISSKEKTEETKKEEKDNVKYLINERCSYNFSRDFVLPDDADKDSAKATFYNGVLNITFNRKALSAPKKIAINA